MDTITLKTLTGWLLLAMPMVLVLSGLPRARTGANAARRYRQRVQGASLVALALALLAALAFALGGQDKLVVATLPLPADFGALALAVQVDRLTLVLAGLVAFVVAVIARYSQQYLDGDPQQARFFRLLALTAGFFLLVVTAADLGLFTLAIIATGFSLHRLLLFYPDRPRAVMATHKKALFSRTADACLVGATLLVGHQLGTTQFDQIAAAAQADTLPLSLHLAAWLLVIAAILKSAQFPFHGWLLQVMEAPTPVSALMHAGIVYSGAIVILRTSGLLTAEGHALFLLAIIGLLTLVIASLTMLTQTAIKASLAWSTTAQLGFMLLELGLGLYALALLHLIGHSLYKAHAFLSSGSLVDVLRQPKPAPQRRITPARWLGVIAVSIGLSGAIAWAVGLHLDEEPALLALGAIVALAVAQILLKALSLGTTGGLPRALLTSTGMAVAYFVLHSLFVAGFGPVLGPMPGAADPLYLGLIGLTIVAFVAIAWLQGPGREQLDRSGRSALFIHLYNGLYVDRWVERLSHRLWPHKVGRRERRKVLPKVESAIGTRQS